MKKLLFIVLMILFASSVYSAEKYVRPTSTNDAVNGCANNGNGAEWGCAASPGAAGALTTLPNTTTWARDTIYYFADGLYGSATTYVRISTAVNGTQEIVLRKATDAAHGTVSTGWDSSLGDGQAEIQGRAQLAGVLSIITPYVTIDGVFATDQDDPATYGFKINHSSDCTLYTGPNIGMPGTGFASTLNISHVTMQYVATSACGYDYRTTDGGRSQETLFSNPLSAAYMYIKHNYISTGSTNISFQRWDDSEISDNYFSENWSHSTSHGQQLSSYGSRRLVIKNNIWNKSGCLIFGNHNLTGRPNSEWQVYNNIFKDENVCGTGSDCNLTGGLEAVNDPADTWVNSEIHHNTFINLGLGDGAINVGILTDVATQKMYAYNNLFYNCENPRLDNYGTGHTVGAIVHTNNAHYNSTGSFDASEGGTAISTTGSPFVDAAGGDYHLAVAAAVGTGKELVSPFDTDYEGNTRPGQDAIWNAGAYDKGGAAATPWEVIFGHSQVGGAEGNGTSSDTFFNCGNGGTTCTDTTHYETNDTVSFVLTPKGLNKLIAFYVDGVSQSLSGTAGQVVNAGPFTITDNTSFVAEWSQSFSSSTGQAFTPVEGVVGSTFGGN